MDDEIEVVVKVPESSDALTPPVSDPVGNAVQDAAQIVALAESMAKDDPAMPELFRRIDELLGEVRELRNEMRSTKEAVNDVESAARTAIALAESESADETTVAEEVADVAGVVLEAIPPTVETIVEVQEIQQRGKKKARWI